jgi:histone acetyltransferase (RNA polymerase elongator complex component)
LHIDQVVASEEYQKSGVGQLLMGEAHKLSKTKQIKEVQLDF